MNLFVNTDAHIIAPMFDRIAHRYDVLNRLLSFRRDVAWRNRVKRYLPSRLNKIELLDVATGTGDLLFSLIKQSERISKAIGVDISEKMLDVAREKAPYSANGPHSDFLYGDACALPFADASFDVVTCGFGVRNVKDPLRALSEMRRVLRPGGRVIILEFSMPHNFLIRSLYLLYFRYLLPVVGGYLSKDKGAYRYLNQSVEAFAHGKNFRDRMRQVGLIQVRSRTLSCGVVEIYFGDKV